LKNSSEEKENKKTNLYHVTTSPDLAFLLAVREIRRKSSTLVFLLLFGINSEDMAVEVSISASDTTAKRKRSKKSSAIASVDDNAEGETSVKEKKRKKKSKDRSTGAYVRRHRLL
jgi:hypothetical protein